MLLRSLRSDTYKMKHTPIPWLHVLVPLLGSLSFLWYYASSGNHTSFDMLTGFMEVLCMIFPLIIGIVCGLIAAQEEQAGRYQVILSEVRIRTVAYLSKLLLLLMLSAFSVTFSVLIFSVGLNNIPMRLSMQLALAAWGGNIFLYILHLYAGFRFGHGASIGLGVFGSLISPLMMTGLGDGIWCFIPWAWGGRICGSLIHLLHSSSLNTRILIDMNYGIMICAVVTLLSLTASLIWFQHWEGTKSYE